jgi:hypothetical protein
VEQSDMETKTDKPSLDKKTKKMRDGDIVISTFFIVGSLWTAYESIRMSYEMYSKGLATLYTVPGLFPLIVSIAILGCSISVLLNALRVGGDLKFLSPDSLKKTFSDFEAFIPAIVFGLLAVYVFVLVERVPFVIGTFLFISTMMVIFKAAKGIWIVSISAIYSLIAVYFFTAVVGTSFPISLFE